MHNQDNRHTHFTVDRVLILISEDFDTYLP